MRIMRGEYDATEIRGIKINIFQCRRVPNENDILVFGRGAFEPDNSDSAFYEAYISGSNAAFYTSAVKPTLDELEFQLVKHNKIPARKSIRSLFFKVGRT